jgi:hypothetical protein
VSWAERVVGGKDIQVKQNVCPYLLVSIPYLPIYPAVSPSQSPQGKPSSDGKCAGFQRHGQMFGLFLSRPSIRPSSLQPQWLRMAWTRRKRTWDSRCPSYFLVLPDSCGSPISRSTTSPCHTTPLHLTLVNIPNQNIPQMNLWRLLAKVTLLFCWGQPERVEESEEGQAASLAFPSLGLGFPHLPPLPALIIGMVTAPHSGLPWISWLHFCE